MIKPKHSTEPGTGQFKDIRVIGFSTALKTYVQAVPLHEWGYALDLHGSVIGWEARTGLTSDAQNDVYESVRLPARRLHIPSKVVQLSGSGEDMLALTEDGSVWAWGEGSPLKIPTLSGVALLASTGTTHFAVRSEGDVWSWGSGYGALLGDRSGSERDEPAPIPRLTEVVDLRFSARKDRAIALTKLGDVWAWGYGYEFEGDKEIRSVPVQLAGLPPISALGDGETGIDSDGRVWHWGEDLTATVVPDLTRIVEVVHAHNSSNWESTYHALDAEGRVYGWGNNNVGQIGDGTSVSRQGPVRIVGIEGVSSLVTTGWVGYGLTTGGVVFGWGRVDDERIPGLAKTNETAPRQLPLPHFTESYGQRWATLDLVSLGTDALRQTFFDFREGRTPLMQCAAMGWDDEVAEMLTQSGDLEAVDSDGDTALFYAASKGHPLIVDLLLQAGANPNVHRLTGGSSALAQAAVMSTSFGHGAPYPPGKRPQDYWEVTLRLLRGGADPADMYSRHIAPARYTDRGLMVIRQEHLQSYLWNDDLSAVYVNPHTGLP